MIYDFTIYDFTIEVTSLNIFIFSSWGQRYAKSVGRRKKGKDKKRMQFYLYAFFYSVYKAGCILLYDDFIRK